MRLLGGGTQDHLKLHLYIMLLSNSRMNVSALVKMFYKVTTVKPLIKVTLFNNYEVRGRLFWRLENYIEVQLLQIKSVESNGKIIGSH